MRIKQGLDRLFAAILLAVLFPVLLGIAVLIRLVDGGPIFFRQQRVGLHGTPFVIWKFKTMVADADRLLDKTGRPLGDSRVTSCGRLLRATSLDELPQLVNILRGEMSFVGPRPGLPEQYLRFTLEQRQRDAMRPGVTGLAQISGRNTLPWSRRIALDLEYISQYSLWLDCRILLRTFLVVVARRGLVIDRNPDQVDDLGDSRRELEK